MYEPSTDTRYDRNKDADIQPDIGNRLYVICEAILDVHPVAQFSTPTSFLARASSSLSGFRQSKDLTEAEAVLDEWCQLLPQYWAVTQETMASRDVVRITQAERLHCETLCGICPIRLWAFD